MVIDSHMHINKKVLTDLEFYINDIIINDDIESVVNVALDTETSIEVVELANKYDKFYSTVGIHPLYINNQDIDILPSLIDSKTVAIGEIGLDTTNDNLDEQKSYLIEQIKLANLEKLPVIIHANNTNKLIIDIFESYEKPLYGCVFHCFQPDLETLEYLIKNNYYISFAGRITYQNAKKSLEVAKRVPDNLFLVETDSPYISPHPIRDEINKTRDIKYIIKRLAEVKETTYEDIEEKTSNNAKRLFKKLR